MADLRKALGAQKVAAPMVSVTCGKEVQTELPSDVTRLAAEKEMLAAALQKSHEDQKQLQGALEQCLRRMELDGRDSGQALFSGQTAGHSNGGLLPGAAGEPKDSEGDHEPDVGPVGIHSS